MSINRMLRNETSSAGNSDHACIPTISPLQIPSRLVSRVAPSFPFFSHISFSSILINAFPGHELHWSKALLAH